MKRKDISKTMQRRMLYDYSGRAERQETIEFLLDYSSRSKSAIEEYWKKMRRYYDGDHDIRNTSVLFAKERSIPWIAAQSTDGYVHVESQINMTVPDFEFTPRDKTDYDKAKQREKIVKYICENNSLEYLNSRNERRLGILGSAVFKVCWDKDARFGEGKGDVSVFAPRPEEIFTDPSSADVDGCEYIGYVYRMHKQKALRVFAGDFKNSCSSLDDYLTDDGFFGRHAKINSEEYDASDDTITITEWWFRQPSDGKAKVKIGEEYMNYEWKAGDIALSILINGKEIRYIPKYWKSVQRQSVFLWQSLSLTSIPSNRLTKHLK